jgi:hypothetical protein
MVDDTMIYRVWPDGTVQDAYEQPYDWMSDDFQVVVARDEADALEQAHGR